jgi:hypothetical protein
MNDVISGPVLSSDITSGTLHVEVPSIRYLSVYDKQGAVIVKIGSDRSLELNPFMTATEQAKAFWDAVRKLITQGQV